MGETIDGNVKTDIGTKTSGGKQNGNSDSARTNNRGGRGGRGRAASTTSEKQSEVVHGLADVKEPKKVSVAVPAADDKKPATKRGRPSGSKTKTTSRRTTKKAASFDDGQLATLLTVTSGILGSREGFEIFALTEQEAKQIATPLAAIMAKNSALEKVAGEHADTIALVVAIASIYIPKFLLWQAMRPKKPKQTKLEVQQNEQLETGTSSANNQQPTGESKPTANNSDDGATFAGSINELMSPLI